MSTDKPFLPVDPDWAVPELQRRIGYQFRDTSLARQAITHSSGANPRDHCNERLEFLGDSLLGFLTCEHLFARWPDWQEGELTRVKSMVVSRQTCAAWARQLGFGEILIVGKGVGGHCELPDSLLANALESVIAAIYLDGGIQPVRDFLRDRIEVRSGEAAAEEFESNSKSYLQQLAQRDFGRPPSYVLISESGPDHDKSFCIQVQIGPRRFPFGHGKSKKQAEQRAAGAAIRELKRNAAAEPANGRLDPVPESPAEHQPETRPAPEASGC